MILVAFAALLHGAAPRAASVTIVQSMIVRVPARRPDPRTPPAIVYRQRRGPLCIAAADIAGAAVTGPTSIDFGLRGGARVRARLEDACPALDFYGGFYVTPQPDGRICADRDVIRTRSGGDCEIDRFHTLVPAKP